MEESVPTKKMENQIEKPPGNREYSGRNEDGTFKPGVSGNLYGRPKGTMKDYLRRKFMGMTDEEKEEFVKEISPEMQVRLAEGNPQTDVTSAGEKIMPTPILNAIPSNISPSQDTSTQETS